MFYVPNGISYGKSKHMVLKPCGYSKTNAFFPTTIVLLQSFKRFKFNIFLSNKKYFIKKQCRS